MSTSDLVLFSPDLLPPVTHDVAAASNPTSESNFTSLHLPESYSMRPLQRNDYGNGILDVLRVLTSVGDVQKETWEELWDYWKTINGVGTGAYFILVVEDGQGKVVGTGRVVVERKE